ncbi:sensor histidine kinase [Tellurirhabdus rosea]|uniref:sensor histidine kinase n=1 Tax=Tellurirhabdus rosea TaxID=2674997 RepID=UPI00224E44CE|nr:histidine kinase [Tellurirhabdus rosea]
MLFLVGTLFFRLDWYFELSLSTLVRADLVALTAGYICWELARWVIQRLQKRFPGLLNLRTRLMWLVLALPVLVNLAWFLRLVIRIFFIGDSFQNLTLPTYTYALGIQIFYHCVYIVVYEGFYCMQQWKEAHLHKEALQKAALQDQLDSLKHQVNPHFLFNSLNALTTLISEDPARAEAFVDEISSVYRYLLRTNLNELVTLREELAFLESYFHLYKTRYGNAIQLTYDIPAPYPDFRMVPLTLQTLVENAVRHNIISADQPLVIRLHIEKEELVISNNLQRKRNTFRPNEGELATLAARYRQIGQGQITIRETEDTFVVSLPLLTENLLITN